MTVNELVVASKEQDLTLLDGNYAKIFFDPFYKRWYYNLYKDGEIAYAGVALDPDTFPLMNMSSYYLGLIDQIDSKEAYEPFVELGNRLLLLEVTE